MGVSTHSKVGKAKLNDTSEGKCISSIRNTRGKEYAKELHDSVKSSSAKAGKRVIGNSFAEDINETSSKTMSAISNKGKQLSKKVYTYEELIQMPGNQSGRKGGERMK